MKLNSCNNRHKAYNEILQKIPSIERDITLNNSGKLIICLIEFRIMAEIKHVIDAIFRSYAPHEIGLAIVHGTLNKSFVENTFKKYNNIKLIQYSFPNVDRGLYSAILKTPEFYEQLKDWSHVLIYQTDALLYRKIDDIYFEYDYIGGPWIKSNQWCKYNAGNGGFSLRCVKSCMRVCEGNRGKNINSVHRGNEDGFFCNQDSFVYPPINSELHKAFSVERINFPTPVGSHQIYHNFNMNNIEWNEYLTYMEDTLLKNKKPLLDINSLSKKKEETHITRNIDETHITLNIDETNVNDLFKIDEITEKHVNVGQFTLKLTNAAKNRWEIHCKNDYHILFCRDSNPLNCVKTHEVSSTITSVVHKKENGVYYKTDEKYTYIVFYKGFPNGGESWADITACGHYNHCRGLPKDGAIILKALTTMEKKVVQEISNKELVTRNIKTDKNILVYDLFTGVGYYNQLFSLETAIYLAHRSKRYLIINVQHPLVSAGKPDRAYGTIFDYINSSFAKYLVGYEIREYTNCYKPKEYELHVPGKFSNLVFVDKENDIKYITEFSNGRQIVNADILGKLYDNSRRLVYITKSNASRCFYNFATTAENYNLMGKIAYDLSDVRGELKSIINELKMQVPNYYIGIHLRLGDWHKNVNVAENKVLLSNIKNWMKENNKDKCPIYIMMDKQDDVVRNELKEYEIVNTQDLISETIKKRLQNIYKNTTIAEFLLQKALIENSNIFIGSQGSTVSVHVQYLNYLNKKPHYYYTRSDCISFNKQTLKHEVIHKHKNYSWTMKNYMGGHPIAWSLFFNENIPELKTDKKMEVLTLENKLQETKKSLQLQPVKSRGNESSVPVKKYDGDIFVGVDFWYSNCTIFVTKENQYVELTNALNTNYKPIIGVRTDLIPKYVEYLSNISTPYILVTSSNDDHSPPYMEYPNINSHDVSLDVEKLLENENLLKWFCKNPSVTHYKIEPYCLGPKWQWKTTQFFGESKEDHLRIFNKYCRTPKKCMHDFLLKKNLLYFNFTVATTGNPFYKEFKGLRTIVKKELIKKFDYNKNESFEDYIKTLSSYKFCLAPPGRGIDTHRCWEALMVGTIPIVQSSPINGLYINLPVIVVKNWTEITEEFLEYKYEEILRRNFDFEKLYVPYWQNHLLKHVL